MATVETTTATLRIPLSPFRNEPATDFSNSENARRMREALEKVGAELGREYDLVIGNRLIKTEHKIQSINPALPSQVVGITQEAEREHADLAIEAATQAFEHWKNVPVEERAELLTSVAAILRQRKFEYCAWMVYEVGKNWAEADADVAETIDFAEYYARQAVRLSQAGTDVQLAGEQDTLMYVPLGVGAVIPPWNFPSAIVAGMTLAAIVCGNTVVLKP